MKDFQWGVASASYQIEGAAFEDGKGLSIWDVFSHTDGKVKYNDNGDTACDSYHRFEEDLDLIASMGVKNYRFSVSWPRVFPKGRGEINAKGLEYYDRVVDGCLRRGITPWLTLFHWDLPQTLQEEYGGWASRRIVDDFAAYCVTVAKHFEGKVTNYFIMNEPQCFVTLGYYVGQFAPGLQLDCDGYFRTWHNTMMAYGAAVKKMRAEVPGLSIGVASTGNVYYPLTETEENIRAAEMETFEIMNEDTWRYNQQMFLDPVCLGRYPDCTGTPFEHAAAQVTPEELELIFQKPDFIGLNMYHGKSVIMGEDGRPVIVPMYSGFPRTATKWAITPEIMRYVPQFTGRRYGLPVYISENGMSNNDFIFEDGKVHDPQRIAYLSAYLREMEKGIEEGSPVKGYFQWSVLDNFEWASGYDERFGLVYVDYPTGTRTRKDSACWYAEHIREHS